MVVACANTFNPDVSMMAANIKGGLVAANEQTTTCVEQPESTMQKNSDDQIWRQDIKELPSLPSPTDVDSFLAETTGKCKTSDEKNIYPPQSCSNHTRLTLATTRSSYSGGENNEQGMWEDEDDQKAMVISATATTTTVSNETGRDPSPIESLSPSPPNGGDSAWIDCPTSTVLVETKSSLSQGSVTRNWTSKYDTEAKYNHDSDKDNDDYCNEKSKKDEIRDDIESDHRGQDSIATSSTSRDGVVVQQTFADSIIEIAIDKEDKSIWTCGVSDLIDGSQINENKYLVNGISITNNDEVAKANKDGNKMHEDAISEEVEANAAMWACSVTKAIVDNEQKDCEEGIAIQLSAEAVDRDSGDCNNATDYGNGDDTDYDDDESSMGWFINTFHWSKQRDVIPTNSSRDVTMVGSVPVSSDIVNADTSAATILTPDSKKTLELQQEDARAAELDPVAFGLDSLSPQETEEEVVFHRESDNLEDEAESIEEKGITTFDQVITKEEPESLVEAAANNDRGGELFLKVTDAITALPQMLCLTPRAQQLLVNQDSDLCEDEEEVNEDNGLDNESMLTSYSIKTEEPTIEVELQHSSTDEEGDRVVVIEAVTRALRRTKKRSKQKKQQTSIGCLPIASLFAGDKSSKSNVCPGTMDVLMSLALMECCKNKDGALPDELSIARSTSTVRISTTNSSSGKEPSEKIEQKNNNLPALVADNEDNNSNAKHRDFDDENDSSGGCRDGISVNHSHDSDHEKVITSNKSNGATTDNDSLSVEEGFDDDMLLEVSEEEINRALNFKEKPSDEEKDKFLAEADPESPPSRPEDMVAFQEVDLMVNSDSLSMDGFLNDKFVENDPIRQHPGVPIENKNNTKPSNTKTIMVPLRGEGKTGTAFNGLSNTMSSSFDLVSSLSSSEDCVIPIPPQHSKNIVCLTDDIEDKAMFPIKVSSDGNFGNSFFPRPSPRSKILLNTSKEMQGKVMCPAEVTSSNNFNLDFDSMPLKTTTTVLPPFQNPPQSLDESTATARIATTPKTRYLPKIQENISLSLSDDCSIPSIPSPIHSGIRSKDPTRQRNMLPHFAISRMIRNAKKSSAAKKKQTAAAAPQSHENPSRRLQKNLRLNIGSIAEDSLRMERKSFALVPPCSPANISTSSKKNILADEDENYQENCFPNATCLNEPSNKFSRGPSPKSIMRSKQEGASNEKLRVHWDEKQLANKVDKGIMVLSNRKCKRPIRCLGKLMRQITIVQDGYDNDTEQLSGLKHAAQGYIC